MSFPFNVIQMTALHSIGTNNRHETSANLYRSYTHFTSCIEFHNVNQWSLAVPHNVSQSMPQLFTNNRIPTPFTTLATDCFLPRSSQSGFGFQGNGVCGTWTDRSRILVLIRSCLGKSTSKPFGRLTLVASALALCKISYRWTWTFCQ